MRRSVRFLFLSLLTLALAGLPLAAQQSPPGTPVSMVVTLEARHGAAIPEVQREDVMVHEGHDRDRVTAWTPLQGEHAGLELFIAIDDGLSPDLGSQLPDLRRFITSQPATTAIAVGYMRFGTMAVAQDFTTDHAQAVKALRLPVGDRGISSSPYLCLADLIAKWPDHHVRREVLMISDGIDPLFGAGANNPYVDRAIEAAQKAGVLVFSIYAHGAGHLGHSYWLMNWGQNYESQMADETGAEFYYLGFQNAVSFTPYLDDISQKLSHQYLLTFQAKPERKAGLRPVKITTEVKNAELVAANKVYVAGGE